MSAAKKPARVRRPGRVIRNPFEVAIAQAQKLTPAGRAHLQGIVTTAFEDFRRGARCADAWATMADALNMAESLAGLNIASDHASRTKIDRGQQVLADVCLRFHERASWTLYPAELTALDEALFIHRVQLEHCSLGEFDQAETLTRNRVFQARHGNAPAGARVIEGAIGQAAVRPSAGA